MESDQMEFKLCSDQLMKVQLQCYGFLYSKLQDGESADGGNAGTGGVGGGEEVGDK